MTVGEGACLRVTESGLLKRDSPTRAHMLESSVAEPKERIINFGKTQC